MQQTLKHAALAALLVVAGLACGESHVKFGEPPNYSPPDAGEVEDPTAPVPLDPNTEPTCSSGKTWGRGDDGSREMHPGRACLACHLTNTGPRLQIAGTVYPTLREPDECNGAGQAVAESTIEITDSNGVTLTLTPNRVGNFGDWSSSPELKFPIRARVKANGRIREMLTAVPSGDCNSCHTQNGREGAPGRIVLP